MNNVFTQNTATIREYLKEMQITNYNPSPIGMALSLTFVAELFNDEQVWPDVGRHKFQPLVIKSPDEEEFERQKQAFERIPASELELYDGQFVVSRNGEIIESDNDLRVLTQRFAERYGHIPVYITKVGGKLRVNIPTRLLR